MPFCHYAHLKDTLVSVGEVVTAGEIIGHVGDTGSPGNSHLHFEVWKDDPKGRWTAYTQGMNAISVQQRYENPADYLEGKLEPLQGGKVTGYTFLQVNAQNLLHPGWDLNYGAGYDDYDLPVRAVEDGIVVYVGELQGGWGNHLYIKAANPINQDDMTDAEKQLLALVPEQEKALSAIFKRLDAIEEGMRKRASKVRVKKVEQKIKKLKRK